MKIEKVGNGYIVDTEDWRDREVFKTLEEVFESMLMRFEGRCKSFGGERYGKVTIENVQP